jgi:UDP-N-acetylmuramate--alanine ligase
MLGIAGAGMSGLALLLVTEGYRVSGSDRQLTPEVRRLEGRGIRLVSASDTAPAREAGVVVRTSAAPDDHPVLVAARDAGVPVLKRARAMGALLNDRRMVAVAGTHGKTTVTAMTACIAEAGGLDPIALVGGRVAAWDANARAGSGPTAVVEADEFDRSFLELDPSLAVVTSAEPEHMECYSDTDDLLASFHLFAGRAEARDGILACSEGPGALAAVDGLEAVRTYGLGHEADFRVEVLAREGIRQTCRLSGPEVSFEFDLGVPGDHNAQNAGAAMATGLTLGIDPDRLVDALSDFTGVDRRLQVLGDRGGRLIVDDYAHHPTEVAASIAAAREAWPHRSLAVVFQPHLYGRTRVMAAGLATALGAADAVAILPIYPARERPIPGVSSSMLVEAAGGGVLAVLPEDVPAWVDRVPEDALVMFMGAGDVTVLARRLVGMEEASRVGD